jgi:hypothetical protein
MSILKQYVGIERAANLDKRLVEDVGTGDEIPWLQNGNFDPKWAQLVPVNGGQS